MKRISSLPFILYFCSDEYITLFADWRSAIERTSSNQGDDASTVTKAFSRQTLAWLLG